MTHALLQINHTIYENYTTEFDAACGIRYSC